jgi:dTDP-glucose 4,6-dehydratase/UDP-glucose 4-epimerase
MNILIIGSKGFVGSACMKHFGALHQVHEADIVECDDGNYKKISGKQSFTELFSEGKYDVCINASGSAHVGFSFEHPEKDFELNVHNVKVILDAIRKYQPACKFINFSSAAVYGNPVALPIREDASLKPLSPYGKHKLQAELLLQYYAREYGLSTLSLRVFSAYGPGLRKQLFWDLFQKWRTHNGKVRLFGTGQESRDFIFIDDLVRAVDVVLHCALWDGRGINIASGIETSIYTAANTFLQALNEPYVLEFSGEVKQGDPVNWRADLTQLQHLGFIPTMPFADGCLLLASAYKALLLTNE